MKESDIDTDTKSTVTTDFNSDNNLGLQERYIIPDSDGQKVLDDLYHFAEQQALEEEILDLHTNKTFKVRDYIVPREGNGNFLVTPYYAEAGGTVLDWLKPEQKEAEEQKLTVNVCKPRSLILQ